MKELKIKTNIIELNKLKKLPCEDWLTRFEDGKLDAHEAFKKYGKKYRWLYDNSNYDLIGWQIENNCFDWKEDSWDVARYCPENFDAEKYNWKDYSWAVAKYCPQYFDADKFNWEKYSGYVAEFCPDKLVLKPKN